MKNKLSPALLKAFPHIVVAITDQETNDSITCLHIDAIEIRIDKFNNFDADYIKNNIERRKKTKIPIILTIRNLKSEGGDEKISDDLKLKIFQSGISMVDALDVELSFPLLSDVVRLAKKYKKTIIVSTHNFKSTPNSVDLEKFFKNAKKKGADIVKIAAHANSIDDMNRLLQFTLKHKNDSIITMSLGNLGSISRLLFPLAGSLLTYSCILAPCAPGQLPAKLLADHLRIYSPRYKSKRPS